MDATTPPATAGTGAPAPAIDLDKLASLIDAKLQAATKPLQDELAKLRQPAAAEPAKTGDGKEKPLTAAELQKMLDDRDAARETKAATAAARREYIASKMSKLPSVYQEKLGNDPAKWAAEEQAILASFRADLKAIGATVPDLGGEGSGGSPADGTGLPPSSQGDLSKLTAQQKLALGLRQSTSDRDKRRK